MKSKQTELATSIKYNQNQIQRIENSIISGQKQDLKTPTSSSLPKSSLKHDPKPVKQAQPEELFK